MGLQGFVRIALRRLPDGAVARALACLADPRPPTWFPGYRFAGSDRPRDWRRSLRKRIWRDVAAAQRTRSGRAVWGVPWLNGVRLELTGSENSRCVYVMGTFEPNEFAFLQRFLRRGMTFIDVGANEGFFTVFAAERVGSAGRVLAIEPSPREFAQLKRNVALNELGNVRSVRAGASHKSGRAALRIAEPLHAGHNTLGCFAYPVEEARVEEIELRPLDALAREAEVESVDVLKIDVEGAELSVLQGAERVLASRPVMLVELLEAALRAQGGSRSEVVGALTALDYKLHGFESGRPHPLEGGLPEDGTNVLALPRELDLEAALGSSA